VYLADSLCRRVSPSLSQQIKQLFAHQVDAHGKIKVHRLRCPQQPNASDCGVYAAAFGFAMASGQITVLMDDHLDFQVDIMRIHLHCCLEAQAVGSFPMVNSVRKSEGVVVEML